MSDARLNPRTYLGLVLSTGTPIRALIDQLEQMATTHGDEAEIRCDFDIPPAALSEADHRARRALALAAAGELLMSTDVAAIFRVGPSRFHQLHRQGAFDLFKTKPAIGLRCYSGVLLHRFLSGEPLYEPTFGARRPRGRHATSNKGSAR